MNLKYTLLFLTLGASSLHSCQEEPKPNKGEKTKTEQKEDNQDKSKKEEKEKNKGEDPAQKPKEGTGGQDDKNKDKNKSGEETGKGKDENQPQPEDISHLFAKPDGSTELKGYSGEKVLALLKAQKLTNVLPLGETHITAEQLAEVREFTNNLIADKRPTTEKDKHQVIFDWIRQKIRYGHKPDLKIPDYNSCYSTFKYHEAICQGYANILKVMCYTQGINAPIVNGRARFNTLGDPLGHAWNYVRLDGLWYVSDPTNGIFYSADDPSQFNFLMPERIDFHLWEDEYMAYSFDQDELTISEVKKSPSGHRLSVPYSIGGFRISNFNPFTLSKEITELYVGDNIRHLGPSDNQRLLTSGKNLERIAISPSNPFLESYKGIVYSKDNPNTIIMIPAKLKRIELKPMKSVGKNTIYRHDGVEELHFAEGTEEIGDYAIESCPNLLRVYVPKSVKSIGKQAIYLCNPKCEIIHL